MMRESILAELRRQLLDRCPLTALPEPVLRATAALNTWGSNSIEGNGLSLEDVDRIVLEDMTPGGRSVGDVLETVQHMAAFEGLFGRASEPITTQTAQELHLQVFQGVIHDAGRWRGGDVSVTGSFHTPPHADWVAPMMLEWEHELVEREMGEGNVTATATWMHHRFETIHPFSDGNGRAGRLLLNLYLLRHNWPPVHVLPMDRDRYLDAMGEGHTGHLPPLAALIRVLLGRSLVLLLDVMGSKEDELLRVSELEKDGPYSAKYLALRASQGELPAVMRVGRWCTSRRALGMYRRELGRG